MRGLRHQLARLHAAELRERAVRRLVAPDALRGREQRIAAIAVLVVAVVLIAVDDDVVADLPAPHLLADRPDDAGRVGARDVIGILVAVDRRDRRAEPGPDAVVVHARRHHEHEHLVVGDLPGRQHLDLERGLRRAVALLADRPGIHLLRHVPERRDLADFVERLSAQLPRPPALGAAFASWTTVDMPGLPASRRRCPSLPQSILQCNRPTLRRTDNPSPTAKVPDRRPSAGVRPATALSFRLSRARCGAASGEAHMVESFIAWLIVGAIAGWLAGLIVKGYGFGLLGNIVVGIVGAVIAGFAAAAPRRRTRRRPHRGHHQCGDRRGHPAGDHRPGQESDLIDRPPGRTNSGRWRISFSETGIQFSG